jgi:hypothetical protein
MRGEGSFETFQSEFSILLSWAASIVRPADLLNALINGGPADSIDDYPQASEAVQKYLLHVADGADLAIEHLLCIARLNRF